MILFVFFFFSLAWYLDEIAFHRIWFKALVKWYLYVDGNHKRRVASVGIISHVVIICCCGTNVVRTLKLLALPYYLSKNQEQSSYYLQTVAMWYPLVSPIITKSNIFNEPKENFTFSFNNRYLINIFHNIMPDIRAVGVSITKEL